MPTGIEQSKSAEHKMPLATDYSAVVQNPRSCFSDAELASGQAATDTSSCAVRPGAPAIPGPAPSRAGTVASWCAPTSSRCS